MVLCVSACVCFLAWGWGIEPSYFFVRFITRLVVLLLLLLFSVSIVRLTVLLLLLLLFLPLRLSKTSLNLLLLLLLLMELLPPLPDGHQAIRPPAPPPPDLPAVVGPSHRCHHQPSSTPSRAYSQECLTLPLSWRPRGLPAPEPVGEAAPAPPIAYSVAWFATCWMPFSMQDW